MERQKYNPTLSCIKKGIKYTDTSQIKHAFNLMLEKNLREKKTKKNRNEEVLR